MDRLPLEIKHMIAQWADETKSKKSLQALSQVNWQWHNVAAPVLYRHLVIPLNSKGNVPRKLLLQPDTRSVLTHVETLTLVANTRFANITSLLEGIRLGELGSDGIHQAMSYSKGDWTLIVDLIKQIPSLRNTNLVVMGGGPEALCEAFSQYHPTCRVSIFATCPFSRGPYQVIHKHWALSPMLNAVHVTDYENERARVFVEHPDQLLKGLLLHSPQIKEASLQIYGANLPGHHPNYNRGILVEGGSTKAPKAKLQRLIWPLTTKMTAEQFQEWQMVTDFSLLKAWTIGCVEDSALLQTIVDIHPFQHLTRLTLALIEPKMENALGFWSAAESMFQSLPPLTYLWFLGSYTPAFLNRGVLGKHGSSLLELKVYTRSGSGGLDIHRLSQKGPIAPIFSSDDISEFAGKCSSLQKLLICAKRSQGLGTDLWTALGQFPSLKELDLTLKCSPEMDSNRMPVPPRELSEFEQSLVYSHMPRLRWFIRECIINCSISESLALAFFRHIRACQDIKRFAKLVIRPLCNDCPGNDFFSHLALTWTVEVDALEGLYANSNKAPQSRVLTTETELEHEMLSIFQSI
ncbi:hypothetical protein N7540_000205 [Penicillium herquei]|nr:hypothetical protein N7540_000205 [Penicillium herquei]